MIWINHYYNFYVWLPNRLHIDNIDCVMIVNGLICWLQLVWHLFAIETSATNHDNAGLSEDNGAPFSNMAEL